MPKYSAYKNTMPNNYFRALPGGSISTALSPRVMQRWGGRRDSLYLPAKAIINLFQLGLEPRGWKLSLQNSIWLLLLKASEDGQMYQPPHSNDLSFHTVTCVGSAAVQYSTNSENVLKASWKTLRKIQEIWPIITKCGEGAFGMVYQITLMHWAHTETQWNKHTISNCLSACLKAPCGRTCNSHILVPLSISEPTKWADASHPLF